MAGRLKVYHRETRPIVEFYSDRPTFRMIDGNQPPDVGDDGDGRGDQGSVRGDQGSAAVIVCKSPAELEKMRAANQLVARILEELAAMVAPGVSTADLDAAAESKVRAAGAEPAFKGYRGYPATLCASVNEQVVHGIPSATPLKPGDIVSLDMGVKLDGYYGDSAVTVPVGAVGEDVTALLRVTQRGAREGDRRGARSAAGSRTSATRSRRTSRRTGFRWCGSSSGTGSARRSTRSRRSPNYGEPGRGPRLAEGMMLAIEPMVNMGKPAVKVLADGWTAVTKDGSLSAHFEHTVAVTKNGPMVLTARPVVAGR